MPFGRAMGPPIDSLRVTITRDCDPGGGGPGEFAYQFCVVLYQDDTEIGRELDSIEQLSEGTFVAHVNGNGMPAWQPGPNGGVTDTPSTTPPRSGEWSTGRGG